MHDEALSTVDMEMRGRGWEVTPLAIDEARQRFGDEGGGPFVIENPLPDRLATKGTRKIAYDLKWKSSYLNFGILNLRHLEGYKLYAKTKNTPTFAVFYNPRGLVAHANVLSPVEILPNKAWDGNPLVRLKNLREGLPE